jgi:hypothetical protein
MPLRVGKNSLLSRSNTENERNPLVVTEYQASLLKDFSHWIIETTGYAREHLLSKRTSDSKGKEVFRSGHDKNAVCFRAAKPVGAKWVTVGHSISCGAKRNSGDLLHRIVGK